MWRIAPTRLTPEARHIKRLNIPIRTLAEFFILDNCLLVGDNAELESLGLALRDSDDPLPVSRLPKASQISR